jgi:hypothetical protein
VLHEDTGQKDREHGEDSLLQRVCLFFLVYPELLVILVVVFLALAGLAVSRMNAHRTSRRGSVNAEDRLMSVRRRKALKIQSDQRSQ